jgi:hypothetical protein
MLRIVFKQKKLQRGRDYSPFQGAGLMIYLENTETDKLKKKMAGLHRNYITLPCQMQ